MKRIDRVFDQILSTRIATRFGMRVEGLEPEFLAVTAGFLVLYVVAILELNGKRYFAFFRSVAKYLVVAAALVGAGLVGASGGGERWR